MDGNHGRHLNMFYEHLHSIPPTSVEAELAFSSCGMVATKIRSSLNDETLDMLCFLRFHFKKESVKENNVLYHFFKFESSFLLQ